MDFFRRWFYLIPLVTWNYWLRMKNKSPDEWYGPDRELMAQNKSIPKWLFNFLRLFTGELNARF